MKLSRFFITGLCLLAFGSLTAFAADDMTLKTAAKAQFEELSRAAMAKDFARVVDMMHPGVVADDGGRDKEIARYQSMVQLMASKGYVVESWDIGTPGDVVPAGDDLMVVIPFALKLTTPKGRSTKPTFEIGVSADKGQTWKFVSGDIGPDRLKKVLPNLPAALKLPERQEVREETRQAPQGH